MEQCLGCGCDLGPLADESYIVDWNGKEIPDWAKDPIWIGWYCEPDSRSAIEGDDDGGFEISRCLFDEGDILTINEEGCLYIDERAGTKTACWLPIFDRTKAKIIADCIAENTEGWGEPPKCYPSELFRMCGVG